MNPFGSEYSPHDLISVRQKYAFKSVKLFNGQRVWLEYYYQVTKTSRIAVGKYIRVESTEVADMTEADYLVFKLTAGF